MKLSKQDLRIIMALKKENGPMGNYLIARRLGKHPAQILRRLSKLAENRIVQVQDGYPKMYEMNMNNEVQNFIINTIECPKCERIHIRHQSQRTIQCDCLTSGGNATRFYVYNSRIKNKRVLRRQEEYQQTDLTKDLELTEKEDDVNGIIHGG